MGHSVKRPIAPEDLRADVIDSIHGFLDDNDDPPEDPWVASEIISKHWFDDESSHPFLPADVFREEYVRIMRTEGKEVTDRPRDHEKLLGKPRLRSMYSCHACTEREGVCGSKEAYGFFGFEGDELKEVSMHDKDEITCYRESRAKKQFADYCPFFSQKEVA